MKIIRSSKHFFHHLNKIKIFNINSFLVDYRLAVQNYIDFIWNNPISWETNKNEDKCLDINNMSLDCPPFLDYKIINFNSNLSARALSSATIQALGIVKSKTNDVRKRQFALSKQDTPFLREKLNKAIKRLKKPILSDKFKAELSSKNIKLEKTKSANHFEYWLHFYSLGSTKSFYIPIKLHKQDYKLLKRQFNLMSSFLIGMDCIEIRYQKDIEKREIGEVVGCDIGINTMAQFSHKQEEEIRINGLTYKDTVERVSRKRKGSKNFQQAIETRKNVINAILNIVNFNKVRQINLEDNGKLKYKRITSKLIRHHAYGEIKQKIERIAEELGVQVVMQRSNYKSQRCSTCGWTQKSNRKGKIFNCQRCGYHCDADYNASVNNKLKLSWLDYKSISERKLNHEGFEWLTEIGG
jgi:putative transposase